MKAVTFALRALIGVLALAPLSLSAQEAQHHHDVDEKVGSVSFATSCAPEVQSQFERGIALLHSFEYEIADAEFEEVAKRPALRYGLLGTGDDLLPRALGSP